MHQKKSPLSFPVVYGRQLINWTQKSIANNRSHNCKIGIFSYSLLGKFKGPFLLSKPLNPTSLLIIRPDITKKFQFTDWKQLVRYCGGTKKVNRTAQNEGLIEKIENETRSTHDPKPTGKSNLAHEFLEVEINLNIRARPLFENRTICNNLRLYQHTWCSASFSDCPLFRKRTFTGSQVPHL